MNNIQTAANIAQQWQPLLWGAYMSDLDRILVLLYQFLFSGEACQREAVLDYRQLMLIHDFDSYYVIKYYEVSRQYEDYKIFQRKTLTLLRSFDKKDSSNYIK